MKFREFAKKNTVILDGAMGTMLERAGIPAGELPEWWNVTHPDVVSDIAKAYFDAGSNVVNTNTFGANLLKFSREELFNIISSAVENARRARDESIGSQEKFISLDIGPLGRLLKPFGDLGFEEAYNIFAETVRCGVKCGVDLVTVETMNDIMETKAALLAVKDNTNLPVIVTNVYGDDGKLLSGATPEVMAAMLEGMGADYIGANCSLGPDAMLSIVKRLLTATSLPVVFKPNAGLPESVDGKTVYNVSGDVFAKCVKEAVECGVAFVGGCCGTTPEYIKKLALAVKGLVPPARVIEKKTVITSYCKALTADGGITLIGERINPTGKKLLRRAIEEHNIDMLVELGVEQESLGAHALDVNVGVPGIDESELLCEVVSKLSYSVSLPLVIDTSDPDAMEAALRIYPGKPLVNSVNGKRESMERIFPIMKKYGAAAIALTLDENGIPSDADGRVNIAKKILECAESYGIERNNIIFDPLAMAVSADKNSARVTLEAVRRIKNELGCHTSLGVSNISFGLPAREAVNTAFFAMALDAGLSLAIMNPKSAEMMRVYHSAKALLCMDANFSEYIAFSDSLTLDVQRDVAVKQSAERSDTKTLSEAIVKGLSETAEQITVRLLTEKAPLDIVTEEIIPALDKVGRGFEEGKIYLPGLLLSAETAKAAFEKIKAAMPSSTETAKGKIIIATVKGDIHDIGKNIVKLLLENYGFSVIDLGKDVAPEKIVSEALRTDADIVALSALMTTTVPSMEETVKLLRESGARAKVIVGGAVLTREYAEKIGADAYGKDAMSAVRYAENILNNN